MTIKLVRNAMFITVVIMLISVMGKTSAHDVRSTQMTVECGGITQLIVTH